MLNKLRLSPWIFPLKLVCIITPIFISTLAFGGPPFDTDDAEPADYKQWQLYLYSNVNNATHNTYWQIPGFEVDYGIIPNLELRIIPQLVTFFPEIGQTTTGLGDTEIGFKYRFITETTYRPEVVFAPAYESPTGNAQRNLGNGHSWYKVPFWMQKHWGPWTVYGGGGLVLNSAPNQDNYKYGGVAVQRIINDKWMLGGEIYSEGATATTRVSPFQDTGAVTTFNVGGSYAFNPHLLLLFSAGHQLIGVKQWNSYVGLLWLC